MKPTFTKWTNERFMSLIKLRDQNKTWAELCKTFSITERHLRAIFNERLRDKKIAYVTLNNKDLCLDIYDLAQAYNCDFETMVHLLLVDAVDEAKGEKK